MSGQAEPTREPTPREPTWEPTREPTPQPGSEPAPEPTRQSPPEDGWRRFHPLSPLLRGGLAVAAVAAWALSNQFDVWFGADSQLPQGQQLLWATLAVVVVVLGIVLASWLSWRVSRFRIGNSTLEVRTGLLFRQHRQVRYDRIQAVDIRRPLLARLAGLSEVHVQSAGASGSDAKLAFLPDLEARAVRGQLMGLAGRSDERPDRPAASTLAPQRPTADTVAPQTVPPEPTAPEVDRDLVVRVPNARLLQASLVSGRALFVLAAVPALLTGLALGRGGVVAVLGPMLLATGGNAIGSLMKQWNFELLRDREGIHLRRGLTDLKSSSVPVHRIQVVAVRQPLFWRLTGWWRVEVNVAGVGSRAEEGDAVVLPVGTPAEALRVIEVLGPFADPAAVVEGMAGDADATAYVLAPRRAAWLSPLVRRRHGYAVTDRALLLRGGRLRRYVDVVPHARIQSLRQRQGPLQRLLGLASVQALSTPGAADPWVRHLGVQEATRLMNEQVSRSREARRPAGR